MKITRRIGKKEEDHSQNWVKVCPVSCMWFVESEFQDLTFWLLSFLRHNSHLFPMQFTNAREN